ncbi:hypothetical protein [Parafrankia discariae]|uniref:hypothetical protein n=1 Tax=Parafrankia discariae TaxID=365528 RepID=UPI0004776191|nr:hypothetical protein [Parafrankia discariae]
MLGSRAPLRSDNCALLFHRLREGVLTLDPAVEGMRRPADGTVVWGALMEIGMTEGTATAVSLADGTTSLYTSAGGGLVGGGAHRVVVAATRHFLSVVEAHLDTFDEDSERAPVPESGQVTFRALTYVGRRYLDLAERDLREPGHPFSALYQAGHEVVARLRLVNARD